MKYGVTWSNDEDSVCQTGYVYSTVDEAKTIAIRGLGLGTALSSLGSRVLGTKIDGMNNAESNQAVKYAYIESEDDFFDEILVTL